MQIIKLMVAAPTAGACLPTKTHAGRMPVCQTHKTHNWIQSATLQETSLCFAAHSNNLSLGILHTVVAFMRQHNTSYSCEVMRLHNATMSMRLCTCDYVVIAAHVPQAKTSGKHQYALQNNGVPPLQCALLSKTCTSCRSCTVGAMRSYVTCQAYC